MPGLGFQARFAKPVEEEAKLNTIRAYRADGRDPKRDDRLYLWTGQRTPHARKLGEAVCTASDPITVARAGIWVWSEPIRGVDFLAHRRDGAALRIFDRGLDQFARLEGFHHWPEMREWFDATHGLTFRGLFIRWDRLLPRSEWRRP